MNYFMSLVVKKILMRINKNAFTLVELIVVITILAILATVWFVSFSGYLAWTRDTNRIAQLKSMSDALELYRTKKDLPIPDDKVDVQASGSTIAYQWNIWANVLETIEYTEKGLDPKDKNYFTYYLTKDKKYFQLMAFLEEETEDTLAWNNLFNTSQAVDYSERVPHVKWKKLWILIGEDNVPIQNISNVTSSWYLDISDVWSTVYSAILWDEDIVSWSGGNLSWIHYKWSCKRIKQVKGWSDDWIYTIDPKSDWVWIEVYCDMSIDWWWWTLVGVSESRSVDTSVLLLDSYIWDTPSDLSTDKLYSFDASDINFTEVAMWKIWDHDKYFSFEVPDWFENVRAFESENSWTETCVYNDVYYSYNWWDNKYWSRFYQYEETLISNRRDNIYWGVDLATIADCSTSSELLALYRWNDWHTCYWWNCGNPSGSIRSYDSLNYTPVFSSMDVANIYSSWSNSVWLMVR